MKPVEKALWYIENHYREQISLATLAGIAGVSRYHLSRIFCYAVGLPISRYIRRRRLSSAAIALAGGEPDILDLALSLGYGSHEAFSRAFKEYFDRSPEEVRRQGHTANLQLLEAKLMKQSAATCVEEPRFEKCGILTLVGLSRYFTFGDVAGIPDQWQTFAPLIHRLTHEQRPITYGVIHNGSDEGFDYLTGVEVSEDASGLDSLVQLQIPAQTYAVFQHPGHVAGVRETCNAIWSDWLPASNRNVLEAAWFERYGQGFDPQTGDGGLEIWIPVAG